MTTMTNELIDPSTGKPVVWWSPSNYEAFKRKYPINQYGNCVELTKLTMELDRQLDQFTYADLDEMERDWNWNRTLSWHRDDVVEIANDMYDPVKAAETVAWWDSCQEGKR